MPDDDFSELYELAADLSEVPAELNKNVEKALKFTSMEIKQDWAQAAERTGLEGYADSIDLDLHYPGGAIESEIGPNPRKRQGALGLVESAGGDVRSAPQHAGRDALEANEDDFFRGLEIAATDAVADKVEKG